MSKPYSVGYGGHAKKCDCVQCAEVRAERVSELLHMKHEVRLPSDTGATVFVRPHFRRHARHLGKYRRTYVAVRAMIAKAMKGGA